MQFSEKFRLEIAIVGGGLGGVAAAIACRLAGHSVLVLESAKSLEEVWILSQVASSKRAG